MDSILPFLLLSACVCARAEPLSAAIKRRSDSGVYASDFARKYEPVSYVAIPLNKPIPIVHILSKKPVEGNFMVNNRFAFNPSKVQHPPHVNKVRQESAPPSANEPAPAASMAHEWYADPNADVEPSAFDEPVGSPSNYEYEHERVPYHYGRPSRPIVYYADDAENNETEESAAAAPVILYARPNKFGGFTYRRRPSRQSSRPVRSRPQHKPITEPFVIRVHKHRYVRD